MPPKKAAAANGETGEGVSASVTRLLRNMYLTTTQKFTWEGANENKLLLIILGRHIQTSEFEEVAKAFPGMSWFFHSFAHSLLTTSRCDWRRQLGETVMSPPSVGPGPGRGVARPPAGD